MHFFSAACDGGWGAGAEAERVLALAIGFDFAILCFEAIDIFAHGIQQQLKMLRRHDDTCMDACARYAGRDTSEVYDKLSGGMGDDREVGINSFRFFFAEFNLELLLDRRRWIVFWHDKF
jgi:hypothetical protein